MDGAGGARMVRRLQGRATSIDWSRVDVVTGTRCGAGIAIALAVGIGAGHQKAGALAALGALLTSFAAFQAGYRRRAGVLVGAACWVAAATLVGGLVGGWAWLVVAITALFACWSGLLVALGPNPAMLGMLGTVQFLFAASGRVSVHAAWTETALVGAGGLLAALIIGAPWPAHRLEPERRALAAAYRALAEYAADLPQGRAELPDAATVEAMQSTLAATPRHARWSPGRSLQSLADESLRVRDSLGALGVARAAGRGARAELDSLARSAAQTLRRAASAIEDGRPPPTLRPQPLVAASWPALGASGGGLDAALALQGQLRSVERILAAGPVAVRGAAAAVRRPPRARTALTRIGTGLRVLRANINLESVAFRHAIRLAGAATAASLLARTLPGTHDYWVGIAALFVLRPDFGTTVNRGVGRAAGTVVGALVATALAAGLRPGPVALAVLAVVVACAMFAVYRTSYGVYAVGLTATAVFLAAFDGLPEFTAATDRVVDNLIGVALALAAFVAWPTWAASEAPRLLARMLVTQLAYCYLVLDGYVDGDAASSGCAGQALEAAARTARLARTNAEAAVEQMASEPTRPGRLSTAAADGIIAAVHRFSLAAVAMRAWRTNSQRTPRPELAPLRDGLMTGVTELAGSLQGEPLGGLPDLRRLHVELAGRLAPVTARGTDVSASSGVETDAGIEVDTILTGTDAMVDAVDTIAALVGGPADRASTVS